VLLAYQLLVGALPALLETLVMQVALAIQGALAILGTLGAQVTMAVVEEAGQVVAQQNVVRTILVVAELPKAVRAAAALLAVLALQAVHQVLRLGFIALARIKILFLA